jgi:hypothetical protein
VGIVPIEIVFPNHFSVGAAHLLVSGKGYRLHHLRPVLLLLVWGWVWASE